MKLTSEIEIEVVVTRYIPYRSAPTCSNPSDIRYSDTGDNEELEFDAYLILKDFNNKAQKILITNEKKLTEIELDVLRMMRAI